MGQLRNFGFMYYPIYIVWTLWQYGLWSFQMGGIKLERFLPKNQHTQRKLFNFENWISAQCSKWFEISDMEIF